MKPTLWSRYKALPWYGKVLLAIPVVLAVVAVYVFRRSTEVTPEEIVEHGKAMTDRQVDNYYDISAYQESERKKAKQRLKTLKAHVKERHNVHEEDMRDIDDAGSVNDVFQVVNRIRKRNRSKPPVS